MPWLDPILRPLARLAVRKGWLFPVVEQRLRQAYVDAATSLDGHEATDSKISIRTGLQRRDVARLRKQAPQPQTVRHPLAEVIALWWDDPGYDPHGIPVKGDGASFTSLARRVQKDVHPRTFLDILIENGAVRETDGMVRLMTRSYQPRVGSDDQLAYLANNIADHFETAVSNVVAGSGKYDMAVHYADLSKDAIQQLDQHFRRRMQDTLQELDTMARNYPATEDGTYRFRAGGYFFDDLEQKAKPDDP